MSRIRTIKPEFWTDEKIGSVSLAARLLLIGALNFADDHGGLDRSAKQLKAQVFPYDAIDCEPLVLELIGAGLLIEYQVANCKYLHIKGFQKHQRVDHPSKFSKTPPYTERSEISREDHCSSYDESAKEQNAHGALANPRESSRSNVREWNVREGKGEERRSRAVAQCVPKEFEEFKAAYPKRAGDQGWVRAVKSANARLKEGHTWQQMIDGAARYNAFACSTGIVGQQFVKQAVTFLGPEKHFLQDWAIPPSKADVRLGQNLSAADEFMRRTDGDAA
jgi:hypothetical protein